MSFAVVDELGSLRFREDVDAPSKGCVRVSDAGLLLFALLLERVEKMPALGGSDDIRKFVALSVLAESCSRARTRLCCQLKSQIMRRRHLSDAAG